MNNSTFDSLRKERNQGLPQGVRYIKGESFHSVRYNSLKRIEPIELKIYFNFHKNVFFFSLFILLLLPLDQQERENYPWRLLLSLFFSFDVSFHGYLSLWKSFGV